MIASAYPFFRKNLSKLKDEKGILNILLLFKVASYCRKSSTQGEYDIDLSKVKTVLAKLKVVDKATSDNLAFIKKEKDNLSTKDEIIELIDTLHSLPLLKSIEKYISTKIEAMEKKENEKNEKFAIDAGYINYQKMITFNKLLVEDKETAIRDMYLYRREQSIQPLPN